MSNAYKLIEMHSENRQGVVIALFKNQNRLEVSLALIADYDKDFSIEKANYLEDIPYNGDIKFLTPLTYFKDTLERCGWILKKPSLKGYIKFQDLIKKNHVSIDKNKNGEYKLRTKT